MHTGKLMKPAVVSLFLDTNSAATGGGALPPSPLGWYRSLQTETSALVNPAFTRCYHSITAQKKKRKHGHRLKLRRGNN